MRGCYRAAVDHDPPPSRITLERITAERVEIYHAVTPPRREYPHIRKAFPHRGIRIYGGGGRVGGAENMGAQVRRHLLEARQVYMGVDEVTSSGRSDGGRGGDVKARGEGERGR